MSMQWTCWNTPLYMGKGGFTEFQYFGSKHRLWVLIRTASSGRLWWAPTSYVLSKNKGNITGFQKKISIPRALKVSIILHRNIILIEYRSRPLPENVFTQAVRIEVLLNNNVYASNTHGTLSFSTKLCSVAYQNNKEGYIYFFPRLMKGYSLVNVCQLMCHQ